MKVIYDTTDFTGHRAVVALGMFDGVHIGHQALIRRAVALARELEAQSVVCTFDRHPLSVLFPERAPKVLLPLHENLKKFERLGADWALVQGEFWFRYPYGSVYEVIDNRVFRAEGIGIPFGKQFFKIAKLALAPFGAVVV